MVVDNALSRLGTTLAVVLVLLFHFIFLFPDRSLGVVFVQVRGLGGLVFACFSFHPSTSEM